MAGFNPYYAQPQRATGYRTMNSFSPQGINPSRIQMQDIPKSNNPWSINAGQAINASVGAIGAGIDFFGEVRQEVDRYRDMEFQSADTMVNGVPTYSGVSNLGSEAGAIDPNVAGKGLGVKGALAGASAGSSFGLLGAGIGAAAGFVGGLFGKNKAQKEAEQAKTRATQAFTAGQTEYNADVEDYFNTVDSTRQDIQGERNRASRQYGLGQYNDPFRSII